MFQSTDRGVAQTVYRVLVASRPNLLREGNADVWDSGVVRSFMPWAEYAGPPLWPHTRYNWAVENNLHGVITDTPSTKRTPDRRCAAHCWDRLDALRR